METIFKDTGIKKLNWQEIYSGAGCKDMTSGYTFLSLNTHPSNVSVFQLREMFRTKHHHIDSLFALNYSGMLGAYLISDYCHFSTAARISYNDLPKMNQLLINSYNRTFRGHEYAINNIEKELQ